MTNLKHNSSKGICLWLTGLPGSGKTTVAKAVEKQLFDRGVRIERLDGDVVRQSLTADLGFSREDRDTNISRVAFVARLLQRNDVVTLCSFITPYRAQSDIVRDTVDDVRIVYVEASVDACVERDPKGMYAQAKRGEIKNFTGIDAPYEKPVTADLVLHTEEETVEESAKKIIDYLVQEGVEI